MQTEPNIRERILQAALGIIRTQGVKALTQPRIAKLAGVRQSHLTYYFPRKADLFLALFAHAHAHAASDEVAQQPVDFMMFLNQLMFNRERAHFFFATILEVSDEPELRAIVADHAAHLTREVARHFQREPDDATAALFVDLLRGMALRHLLEPDVPLPDIAKIAAGLGLK
jgi:AcrR family transcriptional regulator